MTNDTRTSNRERRPYGETYVDVAKRNFRYGMRASRVLNLKRGMYGKRTRGSAVRILTVTILALFIATLIGIGLLYGAVAGQGPVIESEGVAAVFRIGRAINALGLWDGVGAHAALAENSASIAALETALSHNNLAIFPASFTAVIPIFRDATDVVRAIAVANTKLIRFTDALQTIGMTAGQSLFSGDGSFATTVGDLASLSRSVADDLQRVKEATGRLKTIAPFFKGIDREIGDRYVAHNTTLYSLATFLNAVKTVVSSETPRHLAIVFGNSGELRPGGGSPFAFVDAIVERNRFTVSQVYRASALGIGVTSSLMIAPVSGVLDGTVARGGIGEINMQSDFPTSADATLRALEAVPVFRDLGITFDGIVSVESAVLQSVVELTEPISFPMRKGVMNASNIERELQTMLEEKTATSTDAVQYLLTTVFDRIRSFDASQWKTFSAVMARHAAARDIRLYARDSRLQSGIVSMRADGGIYEPEQTFIGSAVHITNANIGSNKTDILIRQHIDATIDVDSDGGSLTTLSVARTHQGKNERDRWLRAANISYVQVETAPQATLLGVSGNDAKQPIDVVRRRRAVDDVSDGAVQPILIRSERYRETYGTWESSDARRSVFGTVVTTPFGKKNAVSFRYQTQGSKEGVKDGSLYTLVVERQPGMRSSATMIITAPIGYRWVESKGTTYTYTVQELPSRATIPLTLERAL